MQSMVDEPEWAAQYSILELAEKTGTQGVELLNWLAARAAVPGPVRKVHGNYHIPISNTAAATMGSGRRERVTAVGASWGREPPRRNWQFPRPGGATRATTSRLFRMGSHIGLFRESGKKTVWSNQETVKVRGNAQAEQLKPIEVESFMNEQSFSGFHWLVFILCGVVVILDGFDTAAIGYIAPSLVSEWRVAKPDLAPVLSAALFGLAGGALCAGPLADQFGQKAVLIAAIVGMGASSLLAATAGNLSALTIWRFLTGLGLGAVMPNAVTVMSEYCPIRIRALATNAMFCGFPLGAALAAFSPPG